MAEVKRYRIIGDSLTLVSSEDHDREVSRLQRARARNLVGRLRTRVKQLQLMLTLETYLAKRDRKDNARRAEAIRNGGDFCERIAGEIAAKHLGAR